LISEKVRASKRPDLKHSDPQLKGLRFDWNRFKALKPVRQALAYADAFLERLGAGSSRVAYTLTSNKVLKVAHNEKGLAQNKAELNIYTDPATKSIVAKIYDYEPDYVWLVSEPVREIKNEQEFKKLTNVEWSSLSKTLYMYLRKEEGLSEDAPEFLTQLVALIKKNDLAIGDVAEKLDHWGVTASGHIALMDYGYTRDIARTLYSPSKNDPEAATRKS
jgi:hypothetical protein